VLKNDRMMSVVTCVAIMLAIGSFVLRLDFLAQYFGEGTAVLELQRDDVVVPANSLTGIDVLSNDLGLRDGDADNLIITEQPVCGRVFARDRKAHYQPSDLCVGSQSFSYTIHGRGLRQTGQVSVIVRLDAPTESPVVARAQRDTTLPAPTRLRALLPRASAEPSLLATGVAAVTVSAATKPPMVPKPQPAAIAGLPVPTAATGVADGPSMSVPALAGFDLSPNMTAPFDGLADETVTATVPTVPQPAQEPFQGGLDPATQAYNTITIMVTAPAQPAMPLPLRRSM
jgi:hypothetical protein